MSRTYRVNRRTQQRVPDKDTEHKCKCSYCTGEVKCKKESKQANKEKNMDLITYNLEQDDE